MKSTNTGSIAVALASCSAGLFLALMASAAPAGADPVVPLPVPAPTLPAPIEPAPIEPAPTDPAPAAPAPGPGPAVTVQAAGTDAAPLPPEGVPHLASPDALPPGSTMDPSVMAGESPNVSYLKDLWHAVRNQEISGKEALLLGVAQRGMNTPYPDQAPGPNVPVSPVDPALPPPPAPALPSPPPPTP